MHANIWLLVSYENDFVGVSLNLLLFPFRKLMSYQMEVYAIELNTCLKNNHFFFFFDGKNNQFKGCRSLEDTFEFVSLV